jgi:hypothetical protein
VGPQCKLSLRLTDEETRSAGTVRHELSADVDSLDALLSAGELAAVLLQTDDGHVVVSLDAAAKVRLTQRDHAVVHGTHETS